jgi:gluconate kinase
MSTPGDGTPPTDQERRAWLEHLDEVARKMLDDLADPVDPAQRVLAADVAELSRHLRRELDSPQPPA